MGFYWLLVNPYFHTSWAVVCAGPNLLFEKSLHRLLRNVKLLGKNVSRMFRGTFLGWKKHPVWKLGETGEIVVMDESVRSWPKTSVTLQVLWERPLIQWSAKSLNRGIYFNNSRVDNFILMVYPGLVGSWIFRVFWQQPCLSTRVQNRAQPGSILDGESSESSREKFRRVCK